MPGTEQGYDPTKSWIMKVRQDALTASDLFTFVDDERATGATEELTWDAGHTVAAKQSYWAFLGCSQEGGRMHPAAEGIWAGAVVHIDPDKGVCVFTSEEKWRKSKMIQSKWLTILEGGDTEQDHSELMSDRGFLVHVTRAYPAMVPYMKGFHLTVEMWRGNP